MIGLPPHARSGCPSLHRIVDALDGGLCRIKLPGGELLAAQASVIAECARRYGSGVVEFTNRANLQLRGIGRDHEAALVEALVSAGLGPLGADSATGGDPAAVAARDDRRNVMISPAAGIDPQAVIDTRPLADELLRAMQLDARFDALSPKFAVLIDGGEALAELEHPHDIWLAALPDPVVRRFALGLAGTPQSRRDADGAAVIVEERHAVATVLALVNAFLDHCQPGMRRMRELVASRGSDAVFRRARDYGACFTRITDCGFADWSRPRSDAGARLGIHPQRDESYCYVGFQPPLGRIDADRLEGLAELSRAFGNGRIRLTPWQGALLPDVPRDQGETVLARLRSLGLVCDADHPLARVIACAGSTGCARSPVDTKSDALVLAQAALPPGSVHVSGCPRSCATPVVATYTLLAVAPRLYDVYRRDGSGALGERIASHLTVHEAAAVLRTVPREPGNA